MTCNGGEPKRRERKQSAKTSRSSSSSTSSCSPNPSRASPATSLLPLQVPPDLGQPPRYSTLFPAQTAILPPRPRRPSHPSSIGIATNQAPPPPLPSWIYGSQNASSSLASLRPIARPGDQFDHAHDDWQEASPEAVKHEALCGIISSKLDALITSIDSESFGGDEKELEIHDGPSSGTRGGWGSTGQQVSQSANRAISSAFLGTNYFAKVNLYANAKLPLNLPPLHLYMPSYPLLCLAAQYSQRAYTKCTGKEREAFVNADWLMGTKAMVIKSVPIDDMNCVVFAIRGSQTFMDWAVNLNSAPASPTDFLDDSGNLCHSGFLSVARKMLKPVAARLRSLLEEDPSRSTCSLLMTGHSAGGAIASLLYAHMLAEEVRSELNTLAGCFKRIHCISFGTPPISLLPLSKPATLRYKKSLFMSFINEGDPVPRADKAYIRSLLNLYASPAPGAKCVASRPAIKLCKRQAAKVKKATATVSAVPADKEVIWRVPPGALSNAGRLIVLREPSNSNGGTEDDVKAEITSDEQLRGVVFGDPVMHMMKVYARRVEVLATKAVTAKTWV